MNTITLYAQEELPQTRDSSTLHVRDNKTPLLPLTTAVHY